MSFGPPPSIFTQSTVSADLQRRKRRRALLFGGVAAVLVVVLAAGGWLLWNRDPAPSNKPLAAAPQSRLDVRESVETPPKSTTGVMAFRFSEDEMAPGERVRMPGTWATDEILAKGINRSLVGLRIGTDASVGDEEWKVQFPGPICGYTRHVTVENRTAVLFRSGTGADAHCDHVAFVDLDDGRKIWERAFTSGKWDSTSVTLTHATVAVTRDGGSEAYDMNGGRRLWRTEGPGDCKDRGVAGGRALLVLVACPQGDKPATAWESTVYQVRKVAPGTGRTVWTYRIASGVRDVQVPSTDPAVLAVAAGDTGYTEMLSLDGKGQNRATVRLQGGQYVGECNDAAFDYGIIDDCPTIPVGGGQVFLRSKDHDDAKRPSNWIIGFDLKTGNTVKKFDSGPNELLYPMRMSGDRLLALRESGDRISPMALVSLDPKTGEETPYFYFGLPLEAEVFTLRDSYDILVQNGRLFFAAKEANGPAKGKQWIWLALGIESAARASMTETR